MQKNIETELGFGKVSNIELVLKLVEFWKAKVRPTFAKKIIKFDEKDFRVTYR